MRFLFETGGGIVKGFQGKDIALVEDENGFSIPMLIRECVVIDTNEYNFEKKTVKAPSDSPKGEKKEVSNAETSPLDFGPFGRRPSVGGMRGGPALAVDAACSGNPGPMEYRGIYLGDGKEIFHFGPVHGTNNIGEFLAIVHALAMLHKQGLTMTIYSDSRTAISWVRKKCCNTQLERTAETEQLFQLIERAEAWLKAHRVTNPIVKWETEQWGEVPADFGRK